jgi:putative DNA primase/helicase
MIASQMTKAPEVAKSEDLLNPKNSFEISAARATHAAVDIGDANDAPENSEFALANAFVARAQLDYRYSPGLRWMTFDGTVWVRDEKLQRCVLSKEICTLAANNAPTEKDALRIASARTVNAVLTLAQADPRLVLDTNAWNADPMTLNTPRGIVDLRTGIMRQHGLDYVTQVARVAPDATAICPTWLRFLNDVFLGDAPMIEFMRRSVGYWLTADRREQVLFFFYGTGGNGKSVFIDLIQWLFGSYALKLPATVLMQSKFDRHPTELAQLHGKRLAVSSELEEGEFFHESLIKELTGDVNLRARFMRQDFFEFQMTQKHVIVGNYKPRLRGVDPAMARRLLLVPFNAKFEGSQRVRNILDTLKAEAPAILAWAIQGAIDWQSNGLQVPDIVRVESAEYMASNDDMSMWIEECCEHSGSSKAKDLYSSFAKWKKDRGETAPSQTIWGSRIGALPEIKRRKSNGI